MHKPKTRMVTSNDKQELEDLSACFKSVWECFGFPVNYYCSDEQVVDRMTTVCRRGEATVLYVIGITSNMPTHHIRRHHPDVPITEAEGRKRTGVQKCIPAAFNQPLDVRADRTKVITENIGIYI